ncbi:class I SAM-dependent methyltransferase [Candidatus Pelagibacter bacterium]|jgi:methylation protein EvaC|nr:class I SAM-dependent methyltransferase [Candidatus Pelagibacter bacterium]
MKKKIEFLDLGQQPLANYYLDKNQINKKERKYRLIICFDNKSKLVSIKKTFSSKMMFNNKYPYRSSMSQTMQKSFKDLAQQIKKKINPKKILEIGSNDGSFLKNFDKKISIGVEPCANVEKITKRQKFNTIPKYWNLKLAKSILKKYGEIDLIYSANTLSHIKDLNDVFKSIKIVLSSNGILILEDPSLLECLKRNTYDQFYNEHIYVFSYLSLKNILKRFDLEIYKIENLDIHGGSNRYFIKNMNNKISIDKSVIKQQIKEKKYGLDKKSTYFKFKKRVENSKKKLISIFKFCKYKNKKIIGYGATAKATTILNYCKINNKTIDYFLDTTKDKQNKYTPGTKIKVEKYKGFIDKDVDYVFLGAWNFKKEIFKKEKKYINAGGKFIIHTPYPKIV